METTQTHQERRLRPVRATGGGQHTADQAQGETDETRRLATLKNSLITYNFKALQGAQHPTHKRQLAEEWAAITRAKGYKGGWVKWALAFEHISSITRETPHLHDLEALYQLTRQDAAQACAEEDRKRRQAFKDKIANDFKTNHGRCTYAILRGATAKPLQELPRTVSTQATVLKQGCALIGGLWPTAPTPHFSRRSQALV